MSTATSMEPDTNEDPLATFSSNPLPYVPVYVLIGLFFGVFAMFFVGVPAYGVAVVLVEQRLISPTVALYAPAALALVTPVAVVAGFTFWVYKNVEAVEYRVYPDRIEEEGGWLTSNHQSIPVDEITNVTYKQSIFGRRHDVGTVTFSTAGSDGKSMKFTGIDDARALYEDMEQLIDDDTAGSESVFGTNYRVLDA